ncbi:MAG: AI-2E family transporter [Desulfuromonas sp.]|jgi:putative permease|nr:AI-2E family transporter [Desulfuromonas thiophila]MDD3802347.1 AI-2E family transporter [Desulfuromonas thiophila]MDY0398992.1 AI-2E family transporter [Desulfuromonas thiophila]
MNLSKAHVLLLYLVLTAAIASGLALFSSASTITGLLQSASSGLFLPLLLALTSAFVLDPLVSLLEKYRVPRGRAILLLFFAISLVLWQTGSWLISYSQQMWESLLRDFPRYSSGLITYLQEAQQSWQQSLPFLAQYDLTGWVRGLTERFFAFLLVATPKSALRLGSLLLLVPLFSFFFLRDGDSIRRTLVGLAPNRYFEIIHDLSYRISRQTAQFVRGRILEAAIVGLVVTFGLSFTDIRYAPLLGLFAGVTNLVPYIGPLVGMVPGILIALVDLGLGGQFWWIVFIYFIIAQVIVDNFILVPILISRFANLHPLLVILAIVMGGKLSGVIGMIVGVPIASACKIALVEIRLYRRAFALPDTGDGTS